MLKAKEYSEGGVWLHLKASPHYVKVTRNGAKNRTRFPKINIWFKKARKETLVGSYRERLCSFSISIISVVHSKLSLSRALDVHIK